MSQFAPDNLRVPPGFEHLLEGLTREVLREQPPDVIAFAANYFKQRLLGRDGKAVLKSSIAAKKRVNADLQLQAFCFSLTFIHCVYFPPLSGTLWRPDRLSR